MQDQETIPSSTLTGAGDQLMYIDGNPVAAISGKTINLTNPANGKIIGTAPAGEKADVDVAVAVARRTFENGTWRDMSNSQRQKILWRAAEILEEELDNIAELESLNNGMLLATARQSAAFGAEIIRYYAGLVTKIYGKAQETVSDMGRTRSYTIKQPVGVAALIVPWNFPTNLLIQKLVAALAAGCSCVVKPSEETPLTALRIVRVFEKAGVPKGVINVVTGLGIETGAALAEHPDVDKVSFTGSTNVGKSIISAAAGNMKKVSLELGGKSPVIIMDDADLDVAIPAAAMSIFFHSGQVCVAGSRLYVHKKAYQQVVDGITAFAKSLKIGSPSDPETQLGPLISQRHYERVMGIVNRAIDSGIELATGGNRVESSGYYVEPTIFLNPPVDAEVVTDEIFGPVLVITQFDTFDEAMKMANDSDYGLAGSIWTQDFQTAQRFAQKMSSGIVWVNSPGIGDPGMPAGGLKQSGWGREMGEEGMEAFLETKSIFSSL